MKTKNLFVSVLAAVLVTALWWTMLVKPMRSKASKLRQDNSAQQSKLGSLQSQLGKAQHDAANAASFKAQLASLQAAMPDSPALAEFIRDANQISLASGVAWQSVTHGVPTTGTAGVTSITIGIQIKGTYAQVLDYLSRLAALKRLVVVDNVALSTAGTVGAGPGGASTAGQSTGPFSGASQIAAVLSARMFEVPSAVAAAGGTSTGAGTSTGSSSGTPAAASAAQSSTLGNS